MSCGSKLCSPHFPVDCSALVLEYLDAVELCRLQTVSPKFCEVCVLSLGRARPITVTPSLSGRNLEKLKKLRERVGRVCVLSLGRARPITVTPSLSGRNLEKLKKLTERVGRVTRFRLPYGGDDQVMIKAGLPVSSRVGGENFTFRNEDTLADLRDSLSLTTLEFGLVRQSIEQSSLAARFPNLTRLAVSVSRASLEISSFDFLQGLPHLEEFTLRGGEAAAGGNSVGSVRDFEPEWLDNFRWCPRLRNVHLSFWFRSQELIERLLWALPAQTLQKLAFGSSCRVPGMEQKLIDCVHLMGKRFMNLKDFSILTDAFLPEALALTMLDSLPLQEWFLCPSILMPKFSTRTLSLTELTVYLDIAGSRTPGHSGALADLASGLKSCPKLHTLQVYGANLDSAASAFEPKSCPSLTSLVLHRCTIEAEFKPLPVLETLAFVLCKFESRLADLGENLSPLPNLRFIDFCGSHSMSFRPTKDDLADLCRPLHLALLSLREVWHEDGEVLHQALDNPKMASQVWHEDGEVLHQALDVGTNPRVLSIMNCQCHEHDSSEE